MKNIKIFLSLLIVHCTLLIGTANAQWWVSGGNLLWPYGTVSVSDSFSVGGNANIDGNLTVDNSLTANGDLTYGGTLNGVKVYTALLSQELTSDPGAIVLENNLGSITWTRDGTGRYTATFLDFTITSTKLFINAPRINYDSGNSVFYSINYVVTAYDITIRQDYTDISDWLGASINYEGAMYYPVQFILYP